MEAEVNSEIAHYLAHFAKFTEVNLTLVVLKEWSFSLHKNVSFDLWRQLKRHIQQTLFQEILIDKT